MDQIVIDLGYGDAGKGMTVASITKPGDTIFKFTGGAQCAHNVVWDGKHHTFSQFGSGMIHDDTVTVLGKKFIVDPFALLNEAEHLQMVGISNPLSRLFIHYDCRIITPYTKNAGQVRETKVKHGSTGRGIHSTVQYDIDTKYGVYARDLTNRDSLAVKLMNQYKTFDGPHWIKVFEELIELGDYLNIVSTDHILANSDHIVAEGSQGVLLDENYGFFPHVTHSDTTARWAINTLIRLGREHEVIGVTRTYMTRHGNGPMIGEMEKTHQIYNHHDHNTWGQWAGDFRRGYLDIEALKYSARISSVDSLAVTHADIIGMPMILTDPYEFKDAYDFGLRAKYTESLGDKGFTVSSIESNPRNIAEQLGLPLAMIGKGQDVKDYRVV